MPADLKLTAYNWTEAVHAGGRTIWLITTQGNWPTREEAEAAIARYNAAVVESSDEVARLRAELADARATLAEATRPDPVWEQIDALARRVLATAPDDEVAALRRERDELRATVARVDEALRDIETSQRCYAGRTDDYGRGYADARRFSAEFIRRALTPTGDDHG